MAERRENRPAIRGGAEHPSPFRQVTEGTEESVMTCPVLPTAGLGRLIQNAPPSPGHAAAPRRGPVTKTAPAPDPTGEGCPQAPPQEPAGAVTGTLTSPLRAEGEGSSDPLLGFAESARAAHGALRNVLLTPSRVTDRDYT